jgi:hypothetical protein
MARYTIRVREHGAERDVDLVQCDSNPSAIAEGLRAKTLTIRRSILEPGKRTVKVPRYTFIQVIDNGQ